MATPATTAPTWQHWMLALATTRQGDVPLFCQALGGNASDKVSLVGAVEALAEQLRVDRDEETPIFVADSGLYSAEQVARLSAAGGGLRSVRFPAPPKTGTRPSPSTTRPRRTHAPPPRPFPPPPP